MRTLMKVSMPVEPFNAAVRDGSAGDEVRRIPSELKAGCRLLYRGGGQRTAILIVEMADASRIPSLAEPWFLTFNASVEFKPVMLPMDLQAAGLERIGARYRG